MKFIVGLQGVQGCGKSTVAARLRRDPTWDAVSIDDFYLPHEQLGARTRGLPGTHDLSLLESTLSRFKSGCPSVRVPMYDKARHNGRGDRVGWRHLRDTADTLLVEGWCLGFCPDGTLDELDEHVKAYADALHHRIDALLLLKPPSLDVVHGWRAQAEPEGGMGPDELVSFVNHYMPAYHRYLHSLHTHPPTPCCSVVSLGSDRSWKCGEI